LTLIAPTVGHIVSSQPYCAVLHNIVPGLLESYRQFTPPHCWWSNI